MGVNDALRLAAWLTVGGGGGIVGGVDLGWVLTSAGESGIVPAFCPVLPVDDMTFTLLELFMHNKSSKMMRTTTCTLMCRKSPNCQATANMYSYSATWHLFKLYHV